MNISRQKPKSDWIDEAGKTIPYRAIKTVEKVNEEMTYKVAKAAQRASDQLHILRAFIRLCMDKAINAFHVQYSGKKTVFKGNYTIVNFNNTIKIEVAVSNPIVFDDMLIQKARDTMKEFLNDGIKAKDATIKEMVLDAFETSRGKLDVKKILGLKRYSDRIEDKRWKKAMNLIDSAIRRPSTATYYRVWVKNDNGKYESIPLNIADIT